MKLIYFLCLHFLIFYNLKKNELFAKNFENEGSPCPKRGSWDSIPFAFNMT